MDMNIYNAAENEFGKVLFYGKHNTGDYVFMIERIGLNRETRYMTIRANATGFHHGHYDMTREQAKESFKERTTL